MGQLCSNNICSSCPSCPCCGYVSPPMAYTRLKDSKKWQEELYKHDPSLLVNEIRLPGSHDSGSYSIPESVIGSSISRCQSQTIY